MSDSIFLTPTPIFVSASNNSTANSVYLELRLTPDISAWDEIGVQIGVLDLQGSSSPTLKIALFTAMQRDVEDNSWSITSSSSTLASLVASLTFTGVGWTQFKIPSATSPATGNPLLRYLRWRAYFGAGSSPAASFVISAMGRRKGS